MPFSIVTYLYCDGRHPDCECDGYEACSGDSQYATIKEYKADMKKCGWLFRGKKAYCPTCRKKLKNT